MQGELVRVGSETGEAKLQFAIAVGLDQQVVDVILQIHEARFDLREHQHDHEIQGAEGDEHAHHAIQIHGAVVEAEVQVAEQQHDPGECHQVVEGIGDRTVVDQRDHVAR